MNIETTCARCDRRIVVPSIGIITCTCGMRIHAAPTTVRPA